MAKLTDKVITDALKTGKSIRPKSEKDGCYELRYIKSKGFLVDRYGDQAFVSPWSLEIDDWEALEK